MVEVLQMILDVPVEFGFYPLNALLELVQIIAANLHQEPDRWENDCRKQESQDF